MLAILHGENRLEQGEALEALISSLDCANVSDLNRTVLEPPVEFNALRQACDTLPFLGDCRLVIVRGALTQESEIWAKKVSDYLPLLPPTTHLLFVEVRTIPLSHPVFKAIKRLGGLATLNALPNTKEVPAWVMRRAQHLGLKLEPAALALLAQNLGSQVQLVDQELRKLKAYRGGEGAVTVEDVRTMMPYVAIADVVFDLVDAIGQRKPDAALRHLNRLIDPGTKPDEYLRLFGMIVRQFRLLIQTRWMVDNGAIQQEIVQRLGLHPYVGEKMMLQARRFSMEQLRSAYRLLHETDLAMKSGHLPDASGLELLIAQLSRL